MAAIRCIAFDFDGVLVDSNAIKRQAFFDVLEPRGVAPVLIGRSLGACEAGDRRDVITAVVAATGVVGPAAARLIDECVAEYSRLCDERVSACPEVPGATATLRTLCAVAPLYLNSATPRDALEAVVVRRGWRSLFRAVLGRPAQKPENLEHVLACEGLTPPELLFVGDRRSDLLAASAVGCEFVGVMSDDSDFPADVRLLTALSDLVHLIQESAAN